MSGRNSRYQFTGTVTISYDPVLRPESYISTLTHEKSGEWPCFSRIKFSSRAEGGYYRSSFRIYANREYLQEMFFNGLGRHILISDPSGSEVWEGKVYEIALVIKGVRSVISLKETYNNVWMRYRETGGTTTIDSTAQIGTASQARYGKRDYVLSGGELDSSTIADQISGRVLNLSKNPKPTITPDNNMSEELPYVEISGIGYSDTLAWQVYNQTINTGSQYASLEVADIVTAKGQYISSSSILGNATSVTKVYDSDRKAGDILMDIARLGDANNNRWLVRVMQNRILTYAPAARPTIPSAILGSGYPVYDNCATADYIDPGHPGNTCTVVVGNNSNRTIFIVTYADGVGMPTPNYCTVNGNAATLLTTWNDGGVHNMACALYYYSAPPVGSNVIVINWNSWVHQAVGAFSYYNINQTSPVDTTNMHTGIDNNYTIVSQVGNTVIDFECNAGGGTAMSAGAGQTSRATWNTVANPTLGVSEKPGAPSVSMRWNLTGGSSPLHGIFPLKYEPPSINRAIKYYYDIWNPDHIILDDMGNIVPPYKILSDTYTQITGISLPSVIQTDTFTDDPTIFYNEEVEYTDGQDIPAIKNNRAQLLDVALARMSARSSV
jgi:hypothetical protein